MFRVKQFVIGFVVGALQTAIIVGAVGSLGKGVASVSNVANGSNCACVTAPCDCAAP